MRCRDAKRWLDARRESNPEQADDSALQEHLQKCAACRAFEQQQRRIDHLFCATVPAPRRVSTSISTDQIMRAIQQQKKITQQLEDIHQQQQNRVARLRTVGTAVAAIGFFTLSSIPLLLLAVTIIQTDLAVQILSLLNGVIDILIILAQYLQAGLTLVTRNNWLLSGIAFAVVVMMGMWLRLMRTPQEA
ncbi:hypothetical protein EPA93_37625 [Ktedonosporobacter rubrisoli]|uniref:Zinc-finger domain-containing protein n=1 Tax=Ktedonosporobacter rubrisoli TaxID=2509675 RepID=A0A4P6K027_KTERU|nr:hypothetical protein [Ktedonosporobacter rubrisoli]QBD81389.1 hypothetical protein EPA93_37625 [Ktedonosporobacter rubrisoli]